MWKRMLNVKLPGNRTGLPKDMAEALEMVRASQTISSGFALLADATDVKYEKILLLSKQLHQESKYYHDLTLFLVDIWQ